MQEIDASRYDRDVDELSPGRRAQLDLSALALQEWVEPILRIDEYIKGHNSSEVRIITTFFYL
jgi:hypothetical protein